MELKNAQELIKLARNAIESSFKNKNNFKVSKDIEKKFSEKQGVFVSLHAYPEHELRGCIGFIFSELPLFKAVIEASQAAAFSDPRFSALEENELDKIVIEISILTAPQEIKDKKDIEKGIKIGKDGLIVQWRSYSGLLLPQVATEFNFSSEEFLKQTCVKAGLMPESYKNPECKIYKFQAQVYEEKKPNGAIIKKIK